MKGQLDSINSASFVFFGVKALTQAIINYVFCVTSHPNVENHETIQPLFYPSHRHDALVLHVVHCGYD